MDLTRRSNALLSASLVLLLISFFAPALNAQAIIHATIGSPSSGGSGFASSTSSDLLPYSPTSAVNSMNAQTALWLLTCPHDPVTDPSAAKYFYHNVPGNPGYIQGGDGCFGPLNAGPDDFGTLAQIDPSYLGGYTVSKSGATTSTSISEGALAGTPLTSQLTGPLLSINALAFTAQVDGYISDSFSKSVNIFQQPSSGDLHALWTWISEVPTISDKLLSFSPANCVKGQHGETVCDGGKIVQKQSGLPYTYETDTSGVGFSTRTICNFPTSDYLSTAVVTGFSNTYIPYYTAQGSQIQAAILPYVNYQISIPSLFNQNLQLSYDVFSPAKYSAPLNALDALPITIGSDFFVGYKGELSLGPQSAIPKWDSLSKSTVTNPQASTAQYNQAYPSKNPNFCIANKPSYAQLGMGPDSNGVYPPYPFPGWGSYSDSLYCHSCSDSGSCTISGYIQYLTDCTGPTYCSLYGDQGQCIGLGTEIPTPAVCRPFSIVQPAPTHIPTPISVVSLPTDYTFVLFNSQGSYGIYVLRTVPLGSYDVGAPNVPPAFTSEEWNAEWSQYWKQVTQTQNDNTYLVAQLSPSVSGFVPINMTVDYAGDIFLAGTLPSGSSRVPAIEEIVGASSSSPQVQTPVAVTTTTNPTQNAATDMVMPEIAASPTGQYVFLANQSDGGYVYEYQTTGTPDASGNPTSPFKLFSTINLAYQAPNPSSQQTVASSTVAVNTLAWLENTGPYGQPQSWISDYVSKENPQPTSGSDLDTAIYHHPLGIQDVNGYLYILDNWAGGLDVVQQSCPGLGECNYQGVFFSLMTMRVINSTGLNVPLNPSLQNDLYTTTTCSLKSSVQGASISADTCTAAPATLPTCAPAQSSSSLQTNPCTLVTTACSASGKKPTQFSYSCIAAGSGSASSSASTSISIPSQSASNIYPPYGWLLSANITATSLQDLSYAGFVGSRFYSLGNPQTVNFCDSSSAATCTYNPQNLASKYGYQGTFQPIGPQIRALNMSPVSGLAQPQVPRAISSSVALAGKWAPIYTSLGFSIAFNESMSLLFTGSQSQQVSDGYYTIFPANPNTYNDLLLTSVSVQNYTKLFEGNSQFSCFTDSALEASPQSDCKLLAAVKDMAPPVYNMPDPLAFVEQLGGSQQLTLPESISSSYSSPLSQSQLTNCAQSVSQTGVSGSGCPTQSAIGAISSANSQLSGPTPAATQIVPLQQSVTLNINGEVLVPYQYSSDVQQSWTNFQGGTCTTTTITTGRNPSTKISKQTGVSLGSPVIPPAADISTPVYTYGTSPIFTNTIVAPLDGGYTYLQDQLNNFYQQNLSDIGTTLSPQSIYTIDSNRQFGDAMVNITTNPLHDGTGNQYILNATHQLNYQITTFTQGGSPGYQVIASAPVAPPQYGSSAAASVLSNNPPPATQAFVDKNYLGANTVFSLTQGGSAVVNLFNFYVSQAYTATHDLFMSNTLLYGVSSPSQYQALGYNRLIYILRDTFNNTFSAPIDADIAQPSIVGLTVTPAVDQFNANKTVLTISGALTYTVNGNTQPIANNQIYIYYDKNINFANFNPTVAADVAGAQLCAFTVNSPGLATSPCKPANPLSPQPNKQSPNDFANSQQVTFATSYNSMGDCSPPPAALLTPLKYDCNINKVNSEGLPNVCQPAFANGPTRYCLPYASDGSGICTSQLGLMSSPVVTAADGSFSLTQTVCGTGNAQVNATFFGFAGPEPTTVSQTPLTLASNPSLTCSSPGANCQTTTVTNYYYAPAHAIQSAPIGLFELSYGDIGIAVLLVSIISVMLALLSKRR
ncbi:MAG: hypothetical protein KGH65_01680 [Candidatus Micrarchaeota archaeon]|nr:hypothetical protein [Candidatus Micrarchaeota archaeon]